ncbi:MAG: three-Cys-motif partner protein TcmP [Candidatus Methanoperedens sp.]|nr:three-Cys-motif partner protein TcmP [Candidatus Methanoperedens sp.]MCZ7371316.1 three-Cys-motif partner protein TcmP [Candidatus Methanoperedens sp.]
MDIVRHTLKKYEIIEKYLGACKILFESERKPNFLYIDGYSGPGKVHFEDSDWGINKLIAGSPLIAIEKLQPEKSKKISCVFIENDPKNFSDLESYIGEIKNVKCLRGDANIKVVEVLDKIPSFTVVTVLLDITKYNELKWSTVENIAQHEKPYGTDIIIHLPFYTMNAYNNWENDPEGITNFFGCDYWKQLYEKKVNGSLEIREFEEEIVNLYKKRLNEIAGYSVVKSVPIRHVLSLKQTQRTIYYLIYGSNNETAAKNIMDYVMDDKKLYKYLNKYIKTLEEWGKLETKKNEKIPTIFDFDKSKD